MYLRIDYRSVPWVLKRKSRLWPHGRLPSVHLYRSCYIYAMKCGALALTREWALAPDTTVHVHVYVYVLYSNVCTCA